MPMMHYPLVCLSISVLIDCVVVNYYSLFFASFVYTLVFVLYFKHFIYLFTCIVLASAVALLHIICLSACFMPLASGLYGFDILMQVYFYYWTSSARIFTCDPSYNIRTK